LQESGKVSKQLLKTNILLFDTEITDSLRQHPSFWFLNM